MESLAVAVTVMLGMLLASSLVSIVIAVRARTFHRALLAFILSLPGTALGVLFLASVGSTGGKLFGVLGLTGTVIAVLGIRRNLSSPS